MGEDDEPILAAALAARAEIIVSLNTRDFPTGAAVSGVRFLIPQAILAELESRYPSAGLAERAGDAGRQLP
jgi:hypothetical protein